jgi:2-C-methyl-D-erythritol 2,4-cyclodiphosphate synthase
MMSAVEQMKIRIGQGFDAHKFCAGDHVMLGGVRIPHELGLAAHSDGDVALHALCDAMLGAVARGDVGTHFPPSDPCWKNADSRELLRQVNMLVRHDGWMVVNVDITVICERPRISSHVAKMQARIAADLALESTDVSIKATTTEGMGFCGRGEGIAVMAVVLVTSW